MHRRQIYAGGQGQKCRVGVVSVVYCWATQAETLTPAPLIIPICNTYIHLRGTEEKAK